MSFRRGMAAGLTTLLVGTAVVAASSDGCLDNNWYFLPGTVYSTLDNYQEIFQRGGTAVVLGAVLAIAYGTLKRKEKEIERD